MKKLIIPLILCLLVASLLFTCRHPFTNPLDPASGDDYVRYESVDIDGDGIGQWEDVDDITLLSPKDGETITKLPLTLVTYRLNPENVRRYWIQISANSNFEGEAFFWSKNDYLANECEIPPIGLQINTPYYWRAKAFDGNKWSDNWSEIWSFTVSLILVYPTSGLVTTESGGTDTFTVVLDSQPTADVTINISSSDTTEGTVSPTSLTFTPGEVTIALVGWGVWSSPQTVTVTGVDDTIIDGNQPYTIILDQASSTDPNYNGRNPSDVTVTNTDDEPLPGITVSPTSGLVTREAGATASFTVVLNTQPTSNVTINLSSSDTTEGTVSPQSLTFTQSNWSTPQTVTVTGVDDSIADGDQMYSIITAPASSGDPNYNGFNPSDVLVTNINDDDIPPIAPSGLTATEVVGLIVDLAWTDNSTNETGFKIERKTEAGGTYAQVATVGANVTGYTDTGLSVYTTYYYRVRAYNAFGNSSYSAEKSVYTVPMYGMTITSCTINDTAPDAGQAVTLSGTGGQVHGGDYSDLIKVVIGFRDGSGNWAGGTPAVIWSGVPGPNWQPWSGTNATINAPSSPGTYYVWVRNVAAIEDATAIQDFKDGTSPSADEQRNDRWDTAVTVQQVFSSEGSQASPIYIGVDPVTYYGTVGGGQNSYYEVIVSSPSTATFTITISQMIRDADLYLYTGGFVNLQASSTNGGTTTDSVSWTGSGNSYLYIQVYGFESNGTSFRLTVIQN